MRRCGSTTSRNCVSKRKHQLVDSRHFNPNLIMVVGLTKKRHRRWHSISGNWSIWFPCRCCTLCSVGRLRRIYQEPLYFSLLTTLPDANVSGNGAKYGYHPMNLWNFHVFQVPRQSISQKLIPNGTTH